MIEGVTTLFGRWQETSDPAAPGGGHVVSDGTYRVWLAGFPAIPFGGTVEGERDYMDPQARGIDPAAVEVQYQLAIQPIPRSTCELPWMDLDGGRMPELPPEEVQRGSQEFVDCLLGLWRPMADSVGASLIEHVPVRFCGMPEFQGQGPCAEPGLAGAYTYFERALYVYEGYASPGLWLPELEKTLAHEVGHALQHEMLGPGGMYAIQSFTMGLHIDETLDRQLELNAECLAAGMVADPSMTDEELRRVGFLFPSDEIHWGAESGEFWTRQGIGGHVGDCATWLGAQSTLAWP
ncbi:MAG: hypothetical protein Q4G64_06720 [bacterium]|nr:hypothetical protein [bacterium]